MKKFISLENMFSNYLVRDRSILNRYLGSLGILGASFLSIYLFEHFEISRLYSLTLTAIILAAIHGGMGPSFLCSVVGAIVVNVYFGVFQSNPEDAFLLSGSFWIRILVYLGTSMIVAFAICEIRRIYKLAEQTKKIAELANSQKDNLIRVIAHDLRNPIGVIMGYSDLLNMNSFPEEKIREIAQKISATSMELTLLIDDLLTDPEFDSVKCPLQLKTVRLDKLLATVIESQSVYSARKGIAIDFEGPGKGYPRVAVKADIRKLARVFQNLIDNAIKYSPINSKIKIEMRIIFKNIQIKIIDQGPGIHPDDVPKLFLPWSRTRNQTTGRENSSGLGLAICKDLIESMNGNIEFTNLYPRGSVFTLILPSHLEIVDGQLESSLAPHVGPDIAAM